MQTYERPNKYPVSVGDLVHVDGNPDSRVTTHGWFNARVIRLWADDDGRVFADVTRPQNRAGVRPIRADRLTKQNGIR